MKEPTLKNIRAALFVKTYFFWGAFALLVVLGFTPDPSRAALWFGILYALVGMNLFFLGKTVAVVTVLLSDQVAEKQGHLGLSLMLWGVAKFLTLAALIAVIVSGKNVPMLSWMMGIGTLLVVPFVGGFWWSRLEIREENSREFSHA